MRYSFCLSWSELRNGRHEPFGRIVYHEDRNQAEAERHWYATHPSDWSPPSAVDVDVSQIQTIFERDSKGTA